MVWCLMVSLSVQFSSFSAHCIHSLLLHILQKCRVYPCLITGIVCVAISSPALKQHILFPPLLPAVVKSVEWCAPVWGSQYWVPLLFSDNTRRLSACLLLVPILFPSSQSLISVQMFSSFFVLLCLTRDWRCNLVIESHCFSVQIQMFTTSQECSFGIQWFLLTAAIHFTHLSGSSGKW